ncbi:FadR/GntR family transcriptional regulator [Jiella sp. M17.18]|uniref:FadR/GntR family transcriptional regulator n=1 Tax=Jiella sp. M17.18 TaxID=3234247 RepID=UPI0034DE196D
METRILVEPCLATPVVARANSADLPIIRGAMDEAAGAREFTAFEHWDGQFHQAIANATHNHPLIEIYRTITASREYAEWGEMKRNSITEERRANYVAEHAEIMAALQARDAARAEAAMRAHLVTVRQNLLGAGFGSSAE